MHRSIGLLPLLFVLCSVPAAAQDSATSQTPAAAQPLPAAAASTLTSGVVGNMLRSRRSRVEMELMHAQAAEAGERFGLTSVMERAAGQVTAGMQRLVELARACVSQPRLLMLDEPSSGLNTTEIAQLRELLQRLNREGITILLVSHDMHLVDVASRVHVLCFGSIIASGAMAQIKQDERVRQAYLGV